MIGHFFSLLLIIFVTTLVGRWAGMGDLAIAAGMAVGVGLYVLMEFRRIVREGEK
jgi:hypothetical protein